MALTNKQRAFVEHYLGEAHWNATEAARRAGYAHPHAQGGRLLANVIVKERIAIRLREMGAATEALRARWLDRLGVDISPFIDENGLDIWKLKEAGLGYLIKGVRKTKDATTIILRDPDVAEERLARHLGMFVERREHTGPGGGPIEHKDVTDLSDTEAGRRLLALLERGGAKTLDAGASEKQRLSEDVSE